MSAFEDPTDTDRLERARVAYSVATGAPLPERPEALRWALAYAVDRPQLTPEQRAVPHVAAWLDDGTLDEEARSRLGLEAKPEPVAETWPAWVDLGARFVCMYLDAADRRFVAGHVAIVGTDAWRAYPSPGENPPIAEGPETGTAGMDAAEAALRRAGVLPEGVTVRRPGGTA